jgi:hypothetical protein
MARYGRICDDHLSARFNYTPGIVVHQVRIRQHTGNETGTKYVCARKLGASSHDLLNRIQEIAFRSHLPLWMNGGHASLAE